MYIRFKNLVADKNGNLHVRTEIGSFLGVSFDIDTNEVCFDVANWTTQRINVSSKAEYCGILDKIEDAILSDAKLIEVTGVTYTVDNELEENVDEAREVYNTYIKEHGFYGNQIIVRRYHV